MEEQKIKVLALLPMELPEEIELDIVSTNEQIIIISCYPDYSRKNIKPDQNETIVSIIPYRSVFNDTA